MFFFFFREELYTDYIIQQAFRKVCLDKMLIDGYFDMRKYVEGKTDRLELYVKLKNRKSRFADLFKNKYPKTHDEILNLWHSVSKYQRDNNNYTNVSGLTTDEADAIVYWVYQVDKEERKLITAYIFSNEKALHGIECTVDDECEQYDFS